MHCKYFYFFSFLLFPSLLFVKMGVGWEERVTNRPDCGPHIFSCGVCQDSKIYFGVTYSAVVPHFLKLCKPRCSIVYWQQWSLGGGALFRESHFPTMVLAHHCRLGVYSKPQACKAGTLNYWAKSCILQIPSRFHERVCDC